MDATQDTYILRIYRGIPGKQYWEEFAIPLTDPDTTLFCGLRHIQRNPVTRSGEPTTPVSFLAGCLEEVCGSCSMLVNGRPRQACSARVSDYLEKGRSRTITLAPLSKFPLIRDLVVDRRGLMEQMHYLSPWVSVEPAYQDCPPTKPAEVQETRYLLSTCITCGCCSEGCPQVYPEGTFIGPAAISQVRYQNEHPIGKQERSQRLRALLEEGGIAECGNAQNCVQVCPKGIPLTESIALIGRQATQQAWQDAVGLPDSDT